MSDGTPRLSVDDKAVLDRNDPSEIERVFGYELAQCPDGKRCERDAEWGHPCPRDACSEYECERLTPPSPAEIERAAIQQRIDKAVARRQPEDGRNGLG